MVENNKLVQGLFYRVQGKLRDGQKNKIYVFYPAMYVKDEGLEFGKFHVFVIYDEYNILNRLKVPYQKFSIEFPKNEKHDIINCKDNLETRLILLNKNEHSETVRDFLKEAYDLSRGGNRTLEKDAYDLACGRDAEEAKLRILIEHEMDRY